MSADDTLAMLERCAAHQDAGPPCGIFVDGPQSRALDAKLMRDAEWIAQRALEQEAVILVVDRHYATIETDHHDIAAELKRVAEACRR